MFKLRCGVVAREDSTVVFKRTAPMLRCAGGAYHQHHDFCPEFSFNTVEELDQILTSIRSFIADFLSRFTALLQRVILPGIKSLSSVVSVHGTLTASEACLLAKQHLSAANIAFDHLARVSMDGAVDLLYYRRDDSAQCPQDGRLTRNHVWEFTFRSGAGAVETTVPFAGTIRVSHVSPASWNILRSGRSLAKEVLQPDSPHIAALLLNAFDFLSGRYSEMDGLIGLPRLEAGEWSAHVEFSGRGDSRDWVLTTVKIPCSTGAIAEVESTKG